MHYRNLISREPWMTKEEWRAVLRHRRSLLQTCDERSVPLTPYLVGRIRHLLITTLMCQRLENAALMPRTAEGAADVGDVDSPPRMIYPVPTDTELNTMFYLRDQLHRIHLEVEAVLNNNGLPLAAWVEKLTCPLQPTAEATEGTESVQGNEETHATCPPQAPDTETPAPVPAPQGSSLHFPLFDDAETPPAFHPGRGTIANLNKRARQSTLNMR